MTPGHPVTRRRFARVGALGAAGLSLGPAAGADPAMAADPATAVAAPELRSTLLMELALDVAGAHAAGPRRIIPVTGGAFRGPRLRGRVLGGGGGWRIDRPDGAGELNLRATLETDDGERIYLWWRGIACKPAGGPPYVRTTPVFETASARYGWLNRLVAVGVGRDEPRRAAYRVYEIL